MAPEQTLSDLLRAVKGLNLDYKKTLASSKPWDREFEFQRQNLRRHIVNIIFKFPTSAHIDPLENMLWNETSHSLINKYRSLIDNLNNLRSDTPTNSRRGRGDRRHPGKDHTLALRKCYSSFLSFLSDEETFWSELIIRSTRTFEISEATPIIPALSLFSFDPAEFAARKGPDSRDSAVLGPSTDELVSLSPHDKKRKLQSLYKYLIYLGDLGRYREQYNSFDGDGRALPDSGRRGQRIDKRKLSVPAPAPKNFARAAACYKQAKALLPDEGHAFNQLAILALYAGDPLEAAAQYYRALCAHRSFPTARENLHKTLLRANDNHRKETGETPKLEGVEALVCDVVLLHARWQLKPSSSKISELARSVISRFTKLIQERAMSSDLIATIIVMALGAFYTTQSLKPVSTNTTSPSSADADTLRARPGKIHTNIGDLILIHILHLFRALMRVGTTQLEEIPPHHGTFPSADDLSQSITAVLRRMLPALHISSQWLRVNVHLLGDKSEGLTRQLGSFWTMYASFMTRLDEMFPMPTLPRGRVWLEENIEWRGFVPLSPNGKEGMGEEEDKDVVRSAHPNEEHLMRIRICLEHAEALSLTNDVPVKRISGGYQHDPSNDPVVVAAAHVDARRDDGAEANLAATVAAVHLSEDEDEDEDVIHPEYRGDPPAQGGSRRGTEEDLDIDDGATASTEDLVGLAMDASLGEDDNDEEEMEDERILYPLRPVASGLLTQSSSSAFPSPLSTAVGNSLGPGSAAVGPSTTAEDLLSRVLGANGGGAILSSPRKAVSHGVGATGPPGMPFFRDRSVSGRSGNMGDGWPQHSSSLSDVMGQGLPTPQVAGAHTPHWSPPTGPHQVQSWDSYPQQDINDMTIYSARSLPPYSIPVSPPFVSQPMSTTQSYGGPYVHPSNSPSRHYGTVEGGIYGQGYQYPPAYPSLNAMGVAEGGGTVAQGQPPPTHVHRPWS